MNGIRWSTVTIGEEMLLSSHFWSGKDYSLFLSTGAKSEVFFQPPPTGLSRYDLDNFQYFESDVKAKAIYLLWKEDIEGFLHHRSICSKLGIVFDEWEAFISILGLDKSIAQNSDFSGRPEPIFLVHRILLGNSTEKDIETLLHLVMMGTHKRLAGILLSQIPKHSEGKIPKGSLLDTIRSYYDSLPGYCKENFLNIYFQSMPPFKVYSLFKSALPKPQFQARMAILKEKYGKMDYGSLDPKNLFPILEKKNILSSLSIYAIKELLVEKRISIPELEKRLEQEKKEFPISYSVARLSAFLDFIHGNYESCLQNLSECGRLQFQSDALELASEALVKTGKLSEARAIQKSLGIL